MTVGPRNEANLPSRLREGPGVGPSPPSHMPTPNPTRKREGDR